MYVGLVLLALAAVFEASVLPQIQIRGGTPDLVLLMVLSFAVRTDVERGLIWAFVGGIVQDLLSAAPTGTSTMGMILLVFAIGGLGTQIYRIGVLLLVGLVILGTLLKEVIAMIILALSGFQIYPIENFADVIVPTLVYNLIFIGPVYLLVRRLSRE